MRTVTAVLVALFWSASSLNVSAIADPTPQPLDISAAKRIAGGATLGETNDLNGLWLISVMGTNSSLNFDTALHFREVQGRMLAEDVNRSNAKLVTIGESGVQFEFPQADGFTFAGVFSAASEMSGTATSPKGKEIFWSAKKATSWIWHCGNHRPKDAVTSTLEVVKLSEEKGCKDWKRIK